MKRVLLVCVVLSIQSKASEKNITKIAQDKESKPQASHDYTRSAVSSAMSSTASSTTATEQERTFSWIDEDIANSACQKRIDKVQKWCGVFNANFNRLKEKVGIIGQNQENMMQHERETDLKLNNLAEHIRYLYSLIAESSQSVNAKDSQQENVVYLSSAAQTDHRRHTATTVGP